MTGLFACPFPVQLSVLPSSSPREPLGITELIAGSIDAITESSGFAGLAQVPAHGPGGMKESKGT